MSKKQIVENALKEIMDKEGRITPQAVVDAAKGKDSPLYEFFEWDIKKAAHLHWLETASRLIRMVQFRETFQDRTIVAPFFVRDPERPSTEQGYRSISHIRSDEDAARDVLVDEMAMVGGILKRARSVAAVLGMADAVAEIEAKVADFTRQVEDRAAA